jgi:hypothetical protein
MLGHSSATLTLDTYAGLFNDDLEAVASRLDAAWDRNGTESGTAQVIPK